MPEWALSQYEVEVWRDEDKDAEHDHILKGGVVVVMVGMVGRVGWWGWWGWWG